MPRCYAAPSGRHGRRTEPLDLTAPLRNRPIWLVSSGSALIIVGQTATMSFTVLFLHEGRGFTTGSAALVLAASQVLGGAFRIVAGHWSDLIGSRIVPLRRLALAVTASLVAVGVFAQAPAWALVPVLIVAGGIGLSWNGLSFVAAAEMAGTRASGAALGFQQTMLGIAGIAAPIGFAALVSATSWRDRVPRRRRLPATRLGRLPAARAGPRCRRPACGSSARRAVGGRQPTARCSRSSGTTSSGCG